MFYSGFALDNCSLPYSTTGLRGAATGLAYALQYDQKMAGSCFQAVEAFGLLVDEML